MLTSAIKHPIQKTYQKEFISSFLNPNMDDQERIMHGHISINSGLYYKTFTIVNYTPVWSVIFDRTVVILAMAW